MAKHFVLPIPFVLRLASDRAVLYGNAAAAVILTLSLLNKVSECLSTQVPLECLSTLQVPNFPLSALRVKKVCKITRNELVNSFIEFFKNFSKYFYITLIVFSYLRNKMYKFYHILLARCNHSKGFQKPFLSIL